MEGSLKFTLPQSGFVQQAIQTEKLQLARASRIIANCNFPLNMGVMFFGEFGVWFI